MASFNSKTGVTSYKALLYLILVLLPSQISSSSTLDEEDFLNCIQDETYDCTQCSCEYYPSLAGFDLAFSSLTVTALLITIIGYLSVKDMREPPGDIIFGLSLSDTVLVMELMAQAGVRLTNNQTLDPNGSGCVVISYLDVTFNIMNIFYNLVFFGFYFLATRTSLKITRIPQYAYHVVPILGTIIGVIWTSGQDSLGMSRNGLCSFATTNSYFLSVFVITLFILFPFIMFYSVRKTLPECKKVSLMRYQFLRYYLSYVFASSFFNVVQSTCDIFFVASVNDIIDNPNYDSVPIAAIYLGNIFQVVRPFILGVIRLFDPNIKKHWSKIFFCLRGRDKSTIKISMLGEVQKEDFDGRKRMVSLSVLEMQQNLQNTPYLHQIQHTVRVQVIYSLLSSIHFYWRTSKKSMLNNYSYSATGFNIDYKKMARIVEHIKINDTVLKRELPEMMREIQIKDYKGIEGRLTVYAPGIFREIIEMDGRSELMSISLDLSANYNRIHKAGLNTGGKSGEFFFFSYDNSLVIKTISNEELKTLLQILPLYSQHFKANPKSLIAKIYGVFTFRRVEPYERYNLILMKNMNGNASECIERKYDLKGSTYGRMAIKTGNPEMAELKYFDTLKDLDFLRFEKKLHIEPHLKDGLMNVLKQDSEFLRKHNLIDYSLVIYILNKSVKLPNRGSEASVAISSTERIDPQTYAAPSMFLFESSYSDESPKAKTQRARSLTEKDGSPEKAFSDNTFHQMRSTTEENVYYHIGIIDYLIRYTFKKRLEKFGKKLLACNPELDISVQTPSFYARRFRSYLEKIIT